jgi:hypothetical protein
MPVVAPTTGIAPLRQNVYDVATLAKRRVVSEIWQFVKQEKKYWLAPFIFIFLLLSLLMIFSQSSVLGPFIYTLF